MSSKPEIEPYLDTLTRELDRHIEGSTAEPLLVGVETGGVWVMEAIRPRLQREVSTAALDISFFRDDYARKGLPGTPRPSRLPATVDDLHVILVDDVLHTGRTIRAALHAIFELGRPARVSLAVLIDRGGRELPIQADLVGGELVLPAAARLRLSGPDPLGLTVESTP